MKWGWERSIRGSLSPATLLLPVLAPLQRRLEEFQVYDEPEYQWFKEGDTFRTQTTLPIHFRYGKFLGVLHDRRDDNLHVQVFGHHDGRGMEFVFMKRSLSKLLRPKSKFQG